MDLDGQDSAKGTGGEDRQVSNVLQFPRDWIGPTEELIPFGPRADRVAVDDPPELPSANDFWGEHAAAIHSVLEDPSVEHATVAEGAPTDPTAEHERPATLHSVAEDPTVEEVPAEPIPTVVAPDPPRHGIGTHVRVRTPVRRLGRIRAPLAWRAALGMAATGLLVLLALGEQRQPAKTSPRAAVGFLASAGRRLTTSEGIVGAVRHEQSRAAAVMQPPRAIHRLSVSTHHRAPAVGRSRAAGATHDASATTVAVHYSVTSLSARPRATYVAPVTSSASTAGTTAIGTSSTSGSGSSGSGSGGTSSGSGGTRSSSSSAGPVGAGAPFGPGHLG